MHTNKAELVKAIQVGLVAFLLAVGFAGIAFGQSPTGTLTGTVTDAQGAAIAGATVAIHNADTGVDEKAVPTNESGIYTAPLLRPGNYDVTVTQTGFTSVQHKGIPVQVGSTVRIDVQLPVASQQSLVTVTTEVPLIETEKTDASQTVSENLVSDLPTSSRRWEQFALLTPGVNFDGASGGLSIHGINSLYNTNSVDGANNDSEYNGSARGVPGSDGYVYSADSIKEFQVASGNFTADTGHSAGEAVNAVTRSGTSTFHGDVFYNIRNPVFNAVDPVAQAKPVHQQNQFGGSVGGPVVKDKLFFFATYDGFLKVTPIAYTSSTNINALACPNPATISAAQCAAVKNNLLTEEIGIFPRELVQNVALGKLDYQLNQANHLNATFNWRNWQEPNGTAFASSNNSGLTNGPNTYIQDRFVIATWNTVIGNDKVNQLLYQYGVDNDFDVFRPNAISPTVTVSQIFDYGSYLPNPETQPEEFRNQVADTFSFAKGRHAFKTGFDVDILHQASRSGNPASGAYVYSTAVALPTSVTSGGGCTPTVTAISQTTNTLFCDWLVDLFGYNTGANTGAHYTSFSQTRDLRFPGNTGGVPEGLGDNYTHGQYAGYFQDTWKVRPNLTVNLGLRYDLQVLPPETNPNFGSPLLTYYTAKINSDFTGFQPRLGIAWNFTKNSVLRLGGGIFYANQAFQTISSARRSTGAREALTTCAPNLGLCTGLAFPSTFYAQSVNPPNTLVLAGLPANQQPVTALVTNPPANPCLVLSACSVRTVDPNLVNPRVYEALASFERQLPGNLAFSVSYNFTRGAHLPVPFDSNMAVPTVSKNYDVVNAAGATQSTVSVPFFTTRLDPAGAIEVFHSIVNSTYNGMVLTLRKPATHGIDLLVNYTLAYATDDGEEASDAGEGSFSSLGIIDPYNMKLEEGRSGLDVRNRFTASVVWTPTYAAKLSNRFGRGLLGGWSLAGILTASDGAPYPAAIQTTAVQCSNAEAENAAGLCPAATVGGVPIPAGLPGLDGGMAASDLDTSSAPQGGRVSFLPRAAADLPAYHNLDLRLSRQVSISERFKAEFRAEMFNAFNSTMVQAVNDNAYTLAQPSATSATCNTGTHTNTCVVPSATFGTPTTTSSNLLGARQVQFGFRLDF